MSDRSSRVFVKVLNFDELEAKAKESYTKANPDKKNVEMKVLYKWGLVETAEGIFIICNEGIYMEEAITEDNPMYVDVMAEFDNENGTGRCFTVFPAIRGRIFVDDLKQMTTDEEVNLSEFIRTFGARLDSNFRLAEKFFAGKMGVEMA